MSEGFTKHAVTTSPNHTPFYPLPFVEDLSSRWFANSKQVPRGLTTAFSVHKSPSSAVNHNNAASNSDNLGRPCVQMPIYARFPANRVELALLCAVLLSDAANKSRELWDTLLFWTPLEQRRQLQSSSHLLVCDLHRLSSPLWPHPLCSDWSSLWRQPWSCWPDFKIHSNIFGLLWMWNAGSCYKNLQEGKVKGKRLTGLFSIYHWSH